VLDIVAVSSRPFLAWRRRDESNWCGRSPTWAVLPQNYSYCPAIITAQRRKKP